MVSVSGWKVVRINSASTASSYQARVHWSRSSRLDAYESDMYFESSNIVISDNLVDAFAVKDPADTGGNPTTLRCLTWRNLNCQFLAQDAGLRCDADPGRMTLPRR